MSRQGESRLVYSTQAPTKRKPRGRQAASARPPSGLGIRIGLDRRASGRVVTVVTGLPGSGAEVAALGRALRAACGAGGTVKGGALELQGDHRQRVEATLAERGLSFKRAGG